MVPAAAPSAPPADAIPLTKLGQGALGEGCQALFLLPFVVAGIALVLFGALLAWQSYQTSQVARYGLVAEATVLSQRIAVGEDSDTYYITYAFVAPRAAGQEVVREEKVPPALYSHLDPGSRVTVRYLIDQPTVARIEGNPLQEPWGVLLVFGFCWNVLIWPIAVITWRRAMYTINLSHLLRSDGVVVRAVIVNRWTKPDSDGDPTYFVAYRFKLPTAQGAGERYTVGELVSQDRYDALPIGTLVQVRCLPADYLVVQLLAIST